MTDLITSGGANKGKKHVTRIAVADALKIKESYWQLLVYLDKYVKIGNETAIDALKRLDKGEITINKAVTMVRASLRSGAADRAEGEAAEPTFSEICHAEAVRQVRALTTVLHNVINTPDDDFNSVQWMTIMDDLYHVETCAKRLREKMSRRTRQAAKDMDTAA